MQAIRDLLKRVATALGAAGAALMGGLGYTQVHKIFPLPADSSGWLPVLAAAGSASALVGAAWLAARFFGAQRRIVMSSEQEEAKPLFGWCPPKGLSQWFWAKRKGFGNVERKLRNHVFDQYAQEQEARTLRSVELRAQRLQRMAQRARRAEHGDAAKRLQDEADRLNGVARLALVEAAAEVLERRSHQAFKGVLTAVPLLLTIGGIILVFGLADWSQGNRDLIELRKNCAEAQKAGAVNACEPVVAKEKRALYPPPTTTPWLNSYRQGKLKKARIAYRVYGGGSQRSGKWVTTMSPQRQNSAQAGLALPLENSASCVVRVRIPAGTSVRIGHAGPSFGAPGRWSQIQILVAPKPVTYFADRPLPPAEGPCP